MKKIPCIKCTSELWKHIKPYLERWGYIIWGISDWTAFPILVLNFDGVFGECSNIGNISKNRELLTDVEKFLEEAAKLKGFTYKRKDIMKIHGIEIKPGMVLISDNYDCFIAFPTKIGIAFANITTGGWGSEVPSNIKRIQDLPENDYIDSGKILWEKPKGVVITMDDIAEKFGVPVEYIKIKK